MNRNKVVEAMAKAVINSSHLDDEDKAFAKSNVSAFGYYKSDMEAALSALEAIMERDGLKLTGNGASERMQKAGFDVMSDGGSYYVWKAMHEAAKCKLKGGE